MDIIRFALGIRLAPFKNMEKNEVSAVLNLIQKEIPKKRLAGMKLYAGHCKIDENDSQDIITVVTMGQGIIKTRALYRAILKSSLLLSKLAENRPIILTNVIARLKGLDFYGEFNKKGELEGEKRAC